jgi:hypothetical protein
MERGTTTPNPSAPPRRAVARRNAGLALVRRINRWLIAGAVAATGAVSAVAAQGFSGHTSAALVSSSATATTRQAQSSAGTSTSASSSTTSSGLQSPAQTPTAATSSGSSGAVSGGS